ncbi:multicopper oxidase domain-containing protein [Isoptericola sp. NEAU-Y5]|uniref:Copper-containing nitrite reductase n=1 Tax=Isoptericola luteus TaxID=2879484 RepID=A0ABS7ZGT2_9MICO|nr:multicopper oxidase domain-containing protein [Isoptericola sp. NEAU-Y5]MCA5894243.1 multicopper oxidase domain-containing protein [Isoptericola sp. NEAU-Y5]
MPRTQLPLVATSRPETRTKRFRPWRDLPVVVWLLLVVVATLVHPWLPAPRWLMLHLLFLGAISQAILVWSEHFALALLHARATESDVRRQNARLITLNAGTALVVVGVLTAWWPVTVAGAAGVATAAAWHGIALYRRLRRALGTRFATTVHYYVAAAAMLPLGAVLGTLLAHGLGSTTAVQVRLSHALLNVLGWMGLTILGTLVTLWPTLLRTRMDDASLPAARRALPVLVVGLLAAAAGAVVDVLWLTAGGLAAYLAGTVVLFVPLVRTVRKRPPRTFAAASVGLGMVWFVVLLAVLLVGTTRAAAGGGWAVAAATLDGVAPYLAAGVAAPVLLGALSHLVPVSVSRGPAAAKAGHAVMDRGGWFRVVAAHGALVVTALPVASLVRVLTSTLYLGAMAAFLPLMVLAMRTARRAATSPPPDDAPAPRRTLQAVTGLVAVVAVVALGAGLDQTAVGGALASAAGRTSGGASTAVAPTGETRTVEVEARDMRFFPAGVTVPAGTHLVLEVTNTDPAEVHDLVLDGGASSGRLAPGESATVDVGVVDGPQDGWCSIVGHRAMGMTFAVGVEGEPAAGDTSAETSGDAAGHDMSAHGGTADPSRSAADDVVRGAEPPAGFEAHDAVLPDLPAAPADGEPTVHRRTLEVVEQEVEVAPGVTQTLWTFDGAAPGPTLHGRVGDVFEITLVNHGSMGHSVDFHASSLAPDEPMRTIAPGESLVYRFTAERAGVWMYHCSTMPMTAHIANGMAGAVVIEPDDLPEVDRSYLMVQSELYLGPQGGTVDVDEALAAQGEDLVVFNGYADQYAAQPLAATVGERVRVWVLDAGPNRASSFHVIGSQFDRTWAEGAYLLGSADAPADGALGGSQALSLAPAQGGFVETVFPEAGHYPFVTHVMADAERGARGVFEATAP